MFTLNLKKYFKESIRLPLLLGVVGLFGAWGCDAPIGIDNVVWQSKGAALSNPNFALYRVDGVYKNNCLTHANDDPWQAKPSASSAIISNPVSVVRSDPTCRLHITSLTYQAPEGLLTYQPASSQELGALYWSQGVKFDATTIPLNVQSTIFVNSRLINSDTFTADMVLTVIHSSDLSLVSDQLFADYLTYTINSVDVIDDEVFAPTYSVDMITGAPYILTDAFDVVQSVGGSIQFNLNGAVSAQDYMLMDNSNISPPFAYSQVEQEYSTPIGFGGTLIVSVSSLPGIIGSDISSPGIEVYVVLRNTIQGVSAFTVITIELLA